jgi:hypothetical protein
LWGALESHFMCERSTAIKAIVAFAEADVRTMHAPPSSSEVGGDVATPESIGGVRPIVCELRVRGRQMLRFLRWPRHRHVVIRGDGLELRARALPTHRARRAAIICP